MIGRFLACFCFGLDFLVCSLLFVSSVSAVPGGLKVAPVLPSVFVRRDWFAFTDFALQSMSSGIPLGSLVLFFLG